MKPCDLAEVVGRPLGANDFDNIVNAMRASDGTLSEFVDLVAVAFDDEKIDLDTALMYLVDYHDGCLAARTLYPSS